jgi:hypothetical protein
MISEVFDVAVGVVSGMAFMSIREILVATRRERRPVGEPDSVPWLYVRSKTFSALRCPKCREWSEKDYQPPFCECHEFPRGHFHFECKACKFKAIMRTADEE